MANFSVKKINNKKVWEKFVISKNPRSFLQSWNWGETNKLLGEKIERLGFYHNGKLSGVCLLIKQTAKRGPHFLIPAGPILDWRDSKLVSFFVSVIKDLARNEKVWFIRMRPELLDSEHSRQILKIFG